MTLLCNDGYSITDTCVQRAAVRVAGYRAAGQGGREAGRI